MTRGERVKVDGVDMDSIQVCDLDILQKESIVALFREIRPDYIYHLAAQTDEATLKKAIEKLGYTCGKPEEK